MEPLAPTGVPGPAVPAGHVEPCPRRVRARLDGRVVVDTTDARYLWEHPWYPRWTIPVSDVDPAVLVEDTTTRTDAHGSVRDVVLRGAAGDRLAGHRWVDGPLAGTVALRWDALDAWFEEDEQVRGHPRSPYVRVDALRSRRHVRVELDGVVLAESDAPVLLFETGLPTRAYLDPTAVDASRLEPSDTVTACPYKGVTSRYWSVRTPVGRYEDLAWCYDHPAPAVARIAGLVAFYDERVDVVVDGVTRPRPRTHLA
ncbi:DUF427 domain-containing protein [Actinomycetospora cinnamomea]|uniref:Uncharacterized protein (DUF427 family) n=1 Tax=Actinomycetospora cinnamomea TaxID=663609 RepID=A0A2U1FPW2_9PSEU|nr:DUF427 domain-containing protein [Actinomycetospora cinnamomea]PVZ14217.1 uncharacterized protein (DUF427 family) [Actinomycetospora cinnamomea]